MEGLLKNREVKGILTKLFILQSMLLALLGIFHYKSLDSIKSGVVESQAGALGRVLKNHPELEGEIMGGITHEANAADIEFGLKLLSSYGYRPEMEIGYEPIIAKGLGSMNLILLAIFSTHSLILLLIVLRGCRGIFSRVREISFSIQEILKGNYEKHLREGDEGDFSILSHHFNVMKAMIKQNIGLLQEERTFLKDILSDISHQLKTPMSSLVMLNDLLIENKGMRDDTRLDFLNKSRLQLNRMNWLIKSLLKIARLEAKAIDFKSEELRLKPVVEKALMPLTIPAELKKIEVDIRDDNNSFFKGDEDWTAEALMNIIKNCMEHTPSGGRIDIELSSTPISSSVRIRDNGEGISREDLPHIFERFYKGSNSTKEDSIGIGLAMSKSILEAQGGGIRVKSERGTGTEFNITFLRGVI